jgi:NADPH-dependent F420 reductase
MKVAIIGAGNVGKALATAAINAGHDVTITATTAEKAKSVADAVGAQAGQSNADAVREADLVILAVPFGSVGSVVDDIRNVASGKVILDATNPLKPDFSGLAVTDESGAEQLQRQLPDAHVVKAFNTVFAANQAAAQSTDEGPLDGFYAADDEQAGQRVADLLTEIGYRPIKAGDLAAALALEHMAFLNISLNARNGWSWRSGWKLVGPTG